MDGMTDWSKEEWIYGVVEPNWVDVAEFVVLPRTVAEQQARWMDLFSCRTWGEVRREATDEEYTELLELAGHGSFEGFARYLSVGDPVPGVEAQAWAGYQARQAQNPFGEDDPFEPFNQISACIDGDFPPRLEFLMHQLLPREVSSAFGDVYETIFNGTFVRFEPEAQDPVLAALRQRGYRLTEDLSLVKTLTMPLN